MKRTASRNGFHLYSSGGTYHVTFLQAGESVSSDTSLELTKEQDSHVKALKEEAAPLTKSHRERKLKQINEILSSHDIELLVFGCGCCGSPTVTFRYKGEQIIENYESFDIQNQ